MSTGFETKREILSISIFGGGLWISSQVRSGAPRHERGAMIASESKVP